MMAWYSRARSSLRAVISFLTASSFRGSSFLSGMGQYPFARCHSRAPRPCTQMRKMFAMLVCGADSMPPMVQDPFVFSPGSWPWRGRRRGEARQVHAPRDVILDPVLVPPLLGIDLHSVQF